MRLTGSILGAAAFLAAFCASAAPHAKPLDAPALVTMCNNTDPARPNNASECIAYLRGVYEGGTVGFYLGQKRLLFCPKQPIRQSNELRAIFLRYVRDNPAKLGNDLGFIVVRAFTEAFPCTDDAAPRR